jgi:hypothetical protein
VLGKRQLCLAVACCLAIAKGTISGAFAQDTDENLAVRVARVMTDDGTKLLRKWDSEIIVSVSGEVVDAGYLHPEDDDPRYAAPPYKVRASWPRQTATSYFATLTGRRLVRVVYEIPPPTDTVFSTIEASVDKLQQVGVPIRVAHTPEDLAKSNVEIFLLREHSEPEPVEVTVYLAMGLMKPRPGIDDHVEYVPLFLTRIDSHLPADDQSSPLPSLSLEWQTLNFTTDACGPVLSRVLDQESEPVHQQVALGQCHEEAGIQEVIDDVLFETIGLGSLINSGLGDQRLALAEMVYRSHAHSGMDMRQLRREFLQYLKTR